MSELPLSVEERLARLEKAVATLASWLVLELGTDGAREIINMLPQTGQEAKP